MFQIYGWSPWFGKTKAFPGRLWMTSCMPAWKRGRNFRTKEELVLECDPVPALEESGVDEVTWQEWHKYGTYTETSATSCSKPFQRCGLRRPRLLTETRSPYFLHMTFSGPRGISTLYLLVLSSSYVKLSTPPPASSPPPPHRSK